MPQISRCRVERQPCVIRATRVLPGCTYDQTDEASVISSVISSISSDPAFKDGEEFELVNGCGEICFSETTKDQLKNFDISLELCLTDLAMMTILQNRPVLVDAAGDVTGTYYGRTEANCPGVFLEVWAKTSEGSTVCPPEGATSNWVRHVWPFVTFAPASPITLENGVNNVVVTGTADFYPRVYAGPFQDLNVDGDVPETPYFSFDDPVGPPVPACGFNPTLVLPAANEPSA